MSRKRRDMRNQESLSTRKRKNNKAQKGQLLGRRPLEIVNRSTFQKKGGVNGRTPKIVSLIRSAKKEEEKKASEPPSSTPSKSNRRSGSATRLRSRDGILNHPPEE